MSQATARFWWCSGFLGWLDLWSSQRSQAKDERPRGQGSPASYQVMQHWIPTAYSIDENDHNWGVFIVIYLWRTTIIAREVEAWKFRVKFQWVWLHPRVFSWNHPVENAAEACRLLKSQHSHLLQADINTCLFHTLIQDSHEHAHTEEGQFFFFSVVWLLRRGSNKGTNQNAENREVKEIKVK